MNQNINTNEVERKPLKIKIEEFIPFFEKEIFNKYNEGLGGLRDRFQSLMIILKDIMGFTSDILSIVKYCIKIYVRLGILNISL